MLNNIKNHSINSKQTGYLCQDKIKQLIIMNKQTFQIPEGCKAVTVEQVGNQIITTFEPVFKRGDVLYAENEHYNYLVIFKKFNESGLNQLRYYVMLSGRRRLIFNNHCNSNDFRHATPEEAQPLWDALAKEGKRWNPETMEVEEIKKEQWRANYGFVYFYFNYDFVVSTTREYNFNTDDICYNTGNYFQTKEQAQRAAEKIKQALADFWKEELK